MNKKDLMLGNRSFIKCFLFEIATLTGFLKHHHFSVLRATSGYIESVANRAKQSDKNSVIIELVHIFPTL